jgi:hypothetical protein
LGAWNLGLGLTLRQEQKIGQFFSSRFINDTEENIQATEELIKIPLVALLFIVEPVLPLIMRLRKNRIQRRQLSATERFNCTISKCATPLLMSIDAEWGRAGRKNTTVSLCYHTGRFASD